MSVQACTPATFSPSIFGAQVLQLEANYVSNYSAIDPVANATASNIDFCNITVSYTHPGQGDVVHVETWLPTSGWNRRLLSPGGGGYAAGRGYFYGAMAVAAQQGFGTVQTDAGFYSGVFPPADTMANLTLTSPGNLNLRSFINLASVSLQDEALFAKALMKDFYGSEPDYSYWEGCSQGGRQAMMLAQRFPDLYDGIISGAPAIYWSSMFPAIQWPAQVMNMLDYYPQACELDAMVNATRRLCDGVDGIIDGVLSEPEACRSIANPMQFVGQTADCTAYNYPNITITTQAATILKAYLDGYKTADGKQIYPLFEPGVDATGNLDGFYQAVLLTTNCTVNGTACTGPVPNPIGETWLRYYVQKDPYFDVNNLTHEQYDTIAYYGKQQWASVIDTVDTDLSRLRKSGAKLIHYHGLADFIISPQASQNYFNNVTATMGNVSDFYRYFRVPGLDHCLGGQSATPRFLSGIMNWVENGTAPDKYPIQITDLEGEKQDRILCSYPTKPALTACSDAGNTECWSCVDPDQVTLHFPSGM